MKYTTILFDADGTLLDFHRGEREAVNEAFSSLGIMATDAMLDDYSKINDGLWKLLERGEIDKNVLLYRRFEIFFEKYGIIADPRLMAQRYMERLSLKAYLIDGAEDICRALYGKAKMYIVTNGAQKNQESRLSLCGLLKYFDGVFISDSVGFEKPQVAFFEYVAGHVPDFDKERTVIVGDSLSSDIKGGIGYGIDTCWYAPNGNAAPDDIADKITYTVNDHNAMYSALTKGEEL